VSEPASQTPILIVAITTLATGVTAIIAVFVTYILTKKREHAGDWRKLKLEQYQEFVLALSGVVRERPTPDSQRRYADAVNSMMLIAPLAVLKALRAFQDEISYVNNERTQERHDQLLDALFRAMRQDVHPTKPEETSFDFRLLGLPPGAEP
jgi:hypothetical protein